VPGNVAVTSGTSGALDFCSRMILDQGDQVWVEEPGFVEARWTLTAAGAKLIPVPVDDKGLCVSEGVRWRRNAKLVVVTRRINIRSASAWGLNGGSSFWSGRTRTMPGSSKTITIRSSGIRTSMIAFTAVARSRGRVIYLGTFSKLMMPSLRLGYMVADERLIAAFRKAAPGSMSTHRGSGRSHWRNSCGKDICCGTCGACARSTPRDGLP